MYFFVVFAFGKRVDTPGESNEAIADYLNHLPTDLPKIVQGEIADCLFDDDLKKINVVKIIRKHRVPEKYLDSIEMIIQSAEFIKEQAKKEDITINIIGQKNHCLRVARNGERLFPYFLGREVRILSSPIQAPCDKKSIQWWTRDEALFRIREILVARIHDAIKIFCIRQLGGYFLFLKTSSFFSEFLN